LTLLKNFDMFFLWILPKIKEEIMAIKIISERRKLTEEERGDDCGNIPIFFFVHAEGHEDHIFSGGTITEAMGKLFKDNPDNVFGELSFAPLICTD